MNLEIDEMGNRQEVDQHQRISRKILRQHPDIQKTQRAIIKDKIPSEDLALIDHHQHRIRPARIQTRGCVPWGLGQRQTAIGEKKENEGLGGPELHGLKLGKIPENAKSGFLLDYPSAFLSNSTLFLTPVLAASLPSNSIEIYPW